MTEKKKILVVDDNEEFLDELREMLELSGYAPLATTDSITVLDQVRMAQPDLVLLDLKMQRKSGFQVADELKKCPETVHIPIIAMTGYYTDEEYAQLINSCGIRKCLKKPFNPLDVIAEIEELVKVH